MGRFEEVKNKVDFAMSVSATDISMVAGKWNEIGKLTVGAQTAHQFGVGVIQNGVDSRETATIKIYSCYAAGQITEGKLRLRLADANENREETIIQGLLSEWSAGKKVGLSAIMGREDDILKIEVFPTNASAIDFIIATNQVDIPVTTATRR